MVQRRNEVKVCELEDITALTNPSIRARCGQIRNTFLLRVFILKPRGLYSASAVRPIVHFSSGWKAVTGKALAKVALGRIARERTEDTKSQLGEHPTLLANDLFLACQFCPLCPICFLGAWESTRAPYVASSSGTWAQVTRIQLWASFPFLGDNTVRPLA